MLVDNHRIVLQAPPQRRRIACPAARVCPSALGRPGVAMGLSWAGCRGCRGVCGSLRPQGRGRVNPYCPPGGHRTGEQCGRDEQNRSADEQNLIPDIGTQDLRETGVQGGQRTRERERPRGAEDRACDDQKRAFPEDEPEDVEALGAERQPDPGSTANSVKPAVSNPTANWPMVSSSMRATATWYVTNRFLIPNRR